LLRIRERLSASSGHSFEPGSSLAVDRDGYLPVQVADCLRPLTSSVMDEFRLFPDLEGLKEMQMSLYIPCPAGPEGLLCIARARANGPRQ
jgi:hypothetical protein